MFANALSAVRGAWPRCRVWLAGSFIATYLSALGLGLFCHTFNWNTGLHPMMYYVVWDMFCGWGAYECRYHVIAEGVSGTHNQVLPGPWGDFQPFGDLGRHHYDVNGTISGKLAMNVLRHTSHEDITRIFIVEENWPKKFNMPDAQWAARWDVPKDPKRYFTLRHVITPEGVLLHTYDDFFAQQNSREVMSNPRLTAEVIRSQPMYAVSVQSGGPSLMGTVLSEEPASAPRFGSPLGN